MLHCAAPEGQISTGAASSCSWSSPPVLGNMDQPEGIIQKPRVWSKSFWGRSGVRGVTTPCESAALGFEAEGKHDFTSYWWNKYSPDWKSIERVQVWHHHHSSTPSGSLLLWAARLGRGREKQWGINSLLLIFSAVLTKLTIASVFWWQHVAVVGAEQGTSCSGVRGEGGWPRKALPHPPWQLQQDDFNFNFNFNLLL